jgi:hypothetical protein
MTDGSMNVCIPDSSFLHHRPWTSGYIPRWAASGQGKYNNVALSPFATEILPSCCAWKPFLLVALTVAYQAWLGERSTQATDAF